MTVFGDRAGQWATHDGLPVSREPPHGALVAVSAVASDGLRRYLLLHRAHHGADWEGDWAWTPPSGARFPGEDVAVTAARELAEEADIVATPVAVTDSGIDWAVFRLEVPWGAPVAVDGVEHDRFEWVSYDEALSRCLPAPVVDSLRAAHRAVGCDSD